MTEDEYIAKLRLIRDSLQEEHRQIAAQDPHKYPRLTLKEIRSSYRILGGLEEILEQVKDEARTLKG
jgi:hypothetical protein